MMDAAAAAYVALTASGTDTLLMAADHALRRELNRRIRDDLIALGAIEDGPAVTIADGTRASPGDLIICTRCPARGPGLPGPARYDKITDRTGPGKPFRPPSLPRRARRRRAVRRARQQRPATLATQTRTRPSPTPTTWPS